MKLSNNTRPQTVNEKISYRFNYIQNMFSLITSKVIKLIINYGKILKIKFDVLNKNFIKRK